MKQLTLLLLLFTGALSAALAQCPVTISAGGPVTFCQGDSVTLTAGNGPSYTWLWKKNGTPISGATLMTYQAKSSGSYTVQVTGTGGCTSLSNTIVVTVTLGSTYITANGFTGFGCLNGNVNLSVNTAGLSYQWKLNGANVSGATNQNYTGTQAGTYSCQYSNGSCSVLSNPLPVQYQTATIQHYGPTIFCIDSVDLTTQLNMGTSNPSYQWKNNGSNIPGATNWYYKASTSGNYTCLISDLPFCNLPTTSGNISIQAGVPPQISVTAVNGAWPVNLCNGQTIDLQINDVSTGQVWPGGVADWYKDGVSINPFGGNYLLGVSESGVYNAYITTSCGISYAQQGIPVVSLIPGVSPYVTSNGIISDCYSVNLFVEPGSISFTPYQWKRNGTIIPGAIYPIYQATQSGTYTCQVSNSCGTMLAEGQNPFPLTIFITGPVAQITPQGATTICSGKSVLLDATATGANGYQWKLNSVNIPGATGATYSASSAGSYTVNVYSANCGVVTAPPVTVTVNPTPSPAVSANGPLTFCNGGNVLLSTGTGGAAYQWKKNGTNIPGAITASYTATSSGNYKVVKTNSYGCSGTSSASTVTVYSNPGATVSAQGPTVFCAGDSVELKAPWNSSYAYQWKRNNANIAGATGNKFQAKLQGSYKVKVTNQNGCTAISSAVQVTVPCKSDGDSGWTLSGGPDYRLYPNPGNGDVTLEFDEPVEKPYKITVTDVTGRQVCCRISTAGDNSLLISGLGEGLFFIFINGQQMSKVLKLEHFN